MASVESDAKALDQIAAGGFMLYLVNLAKGMAENEAVYYAIRKTVEIFHTQLLEQLRQRSDQADL